MRSFMASYWESCFCWASSSSTSVFAMSFCLSSIWLWRSESCCSFSEICASTSAIDADRLLSSIESWFPVACAAAI